MAIIIIREIMNSGTMVPLDGMTCPCRVCLICVHVCLVVCQCQTKVHDVDLSALLALSNEKFSQCSVFLWHISIIISLSDLRAVLYQCIWLFVNNIIISNITYRLRLKNSIPRSSVQYLVKVWKWKILFIAKLFW